MKKILLALMITFIFAPQMGAMDLSEALEKNDYIAIKNIIEKAEENGTLQNSISQLKMSEMIVSSALYFGVFKKTSSKQFDDIYKCMTKDFYALTFFQFISYNKIIINYLLSNKEIELSLKDLIWHSKQLALARMHDYHPYPQNKSPHDYFTRKEVLQKFLDPKRMSRNMLVTLKIFKKDMWPYYRYLWFKDNIFQPTNYEDFNGFHSKQWIETVPRLLLLPPHDFCYSKTNICKYDINFNYKF